MKTQSVFVGTQLTDRSLIESVVAGFYILDYGFIKNVNSDGTIDVAHARQLVTTEGQTLPATITKGIEVLTIAGAGFSLQFDLKKGDKVLVLGLKNKIDKVADVESTEANNSRHHYDRSTLKAMPLCVFNDDAKVKIEIENGEMSVTADKLKLNGDSKAFVTWDELNNSLNNLMQSLNSHTHSNGNEGSPTGAPIVPMNLDISSAKTTTVVTGG